jgi:cytochrome c oxidase assembly factor CtaG
VIGAVTRRPRVRTTLGALTGPWVALALWSTSIAVWHVPAVYDAAAGSPGLHLLEHASFVAGGTLLWFVLIDPARRGTLPTGSRLALALAAFTVGQFLATTLVLAQHPVFPTYADDSGRLGLSPLEDQAAAGLVMMGEQLITLGVLASFAVRRHLEEMLAQPTADPLARPASLRADP